MHVCFYLSERQKNQEMGTKEEGQEEESEAKGKKRERKESEEERERKREVVREGELALC